MTSVHPSLSCRGYAETLLIKNEALSEEERKKYLHIVLESSEKLSNLITQLFEYSKLEANQIQPNKEPFHLHELANDILQNYQLLAREKGVQLNIDASGQLPMVFADISLVERVIQNLMDNALKFTPSGGSVTISLKEKEKEVEVRVADTGMGISEKDQSVIFERYRQSSPTDRKSKGAGLGLAIVKKILELHNCDYKGAEQIE